MNTSPTLLWDDLRVLLAVRDAGSFLGAAAVLGVAPSTVARRIELLEACVGHRLVRRTADGAEFEAAAGEFLAIASKTREALALAVRDAADASAASSMAGVVRVSLGSGFIPFVSRVVTQFRQAHPETSFELLVENRTVDLSRREADVGLRTAKVEAQGVIYRRAGSLVCYLYASRAYLSNRPALDANLARHEFIGLEGDLGRKETMLWLRRSGATRFPVLASGLDAVVSLAQCGAGIAVLTAIVATGRPGLNRVETCLQPPDLSAYVAYHADLKGVLRVKRFGDAMTQALNLACRAQP